MSEGCKFEVGKTYKCTTGIIAKCLFAYDNGYYHCMIGERVEGSTGKVGYKEHFFGSAWSEYKEPRTITRWINVYEQDGELANGAVHKDEETAIRNGKYISGTNNVYLTTISFSYTEPR